MSLRHRIAHWLGWNRCEVVWGCDERGKWVGGACLTCGAVHPATKWYYPYGPSDGEKGTPR